MHRLWRETVRELEAAAESIRATAEAAS